MSNINYKIQFTAIGSNQAERFLEINNTYDLRRNTQIASQYGNVKN